MSDHTRLRVAEIFYSLQGESSSVGWPTVFVRLTGCPLRCSYCDTAYAFQGGEWMEVEAVIRQVNAFDTRFITITGGEPLAQKNVHLLMRRLCDENYRVSLETSGALDVSGVDERVIKVMDLKTPASGELEKNRWENIDCLSSRDEVKFVIANRVDYEWAREQLDRFQLGRRCQVLFSPCQGLLAPRELAGWILEDRLNVRFQLQLHKLIWGDEPGR